MGIIQLAYRLNYADIQADAPFDAKAREREILQRSINLMEAARGQLAGSAASVDAINFTSRVWTAFLEDLALHDNALSKDTRAGLISVGIWILREMDLNRIDGAARFEDLIEITEIIKDGLI